MRHWQATTGTLETLPPTPRPREQNDLSNRVTRLELWAQYQSRDTHQEALNSLTRDKDLGEGLSSLHSQVQAIQRQFDRIKMILHLLMTCGKWLYGCGRYVVMGGLLLLFVMGKINVEAMALLLRALGFPVG